MDQVKITAMDEQGEPRQKPSHRMDRSALGTWIFALGVILVLESCVLGIVVLVWMIASGYLF